MQLHLEGIYISISKGGVHMGMHVTGNCKFESEYIKDNAYYCVQGLGSIPAPVTTVIASKL